MKPARLVGSGGDGLAEHRGSSSSSNWGRVMVVPAAQPGSTKSIAQAVGKLPATTSGSLGRLTSRAQVTPAAISPGAAGYGAGAVAIAGKGGIATSGAPQTRQGINSRTGAPSRSSPALGAASTEATEDHLPTQAWASNAAPSTTSVTADAEAATVGSESFATCAPETEVPQASLEVSPDALGNTLAQDLAPLMDSGEAWANAKDSRRRSSSSAVLPSPAPSPSPDNPFDSTIGDLQSCRVRLETLRAEKRSGVPIGEVERWCESIATQLAAIGNNLVAKLAACQNKVRIRDEAIRRLHRQLHDFSGLGGQLASAPVGWPFSGSSAAPAAAANESMDDVHSTRSSARQLGDASDAESTPSILSAVRSGGLPSASASGRGFDEEGRSPGGSRIRRAQGSSSTEPSLQKTASRRGTTDSSALDRAQQAQLRREVAHLRRGHVELVGQLRARDTQVEQLTAMIRELVSQRQMGLHKRQVHLQDDTLHALKEDILLDQSPPLVVGRLGTAANVPNDSLRSSRGTRLVGNSGSGPSLVRRINRQPGITLGGRPAAEGGVSGNSEMRGRHSAASAASGPSSSKRERSISNAPYTPRNKLRDVVGHATRVAVETPGGRNSGRTTSFARSTAAGRSTSVEDRNARRVRDAVPVGRRRESAGQGNEHGGM